MDGKIITIGSICNVRTGKLDANASSIDGQYPFFTCSREPLRISSYSYDAECVLVAGNGDLNVKYYKGKFDAYQRTYIITLKEGITNVSVPYLYTFFLVYVNTLREKSIGGVIKYIKLGDITEAKVFIPSLVDQERIVDELDLLTGIMEKQNAQLKELDALAQSVFYNMFGTTVEEKGWKVKTLGDVGTFQRGGGFLKSDYVDDGFPCIHYGQIHTRFGIATYQHLTSIPESLAKTKSKIADTGDVILAITSEDVEGSCKCTAWMGEYPVAVGGHTAIYKHSLNPIYAAFSFKADHFQKAKEKYAHGFKVVEIKPSDIASIDVCIPPRALQDKFAESIISIEQQKARITRSIAETQKLFDYTMDKYFG